MNQTNHIGRATRDPEIRYTQAGEAVARFSLAVNAGQNKTEFFPIVAFGKAGEFAEKYIRKGRQIAVTGRLHNNDWEKDGIKHRTTEIIAERFYFADSKPADGAAESDPGDGFMNIPDDVDGELPFN